MTGRRNGLEVVHQYVFEVVDFSSQYGSESGTGYTAGNLVGPCQVYPNYCDSNVTCSFRTYGNWWRECPSALKPIESPPNGYTSEDYVDLYFDRPVIPTRLQIFETYNPGAIVRILGCYRTQPANTPVNARKLHWVTLWKAPKSPQSATPRLCSQVLRGFQLPCPGLADESCSSYNGALVLSSRNARHGHAGRSASSEHAENWFVNQFHRQAGRTRVFQPDLKNVPPFPMDLIRLELDGSRCGYYTQLDAVRLTGFVELNSPLAEVERLEVCSDCSLSRAPQSVSRTGTAASFFSDLLRPCTPQLCSPPPEHSQDSFDLSLSTAQNSSSPGTSLDHLLVKWPLVLPSSDSTPSPDAFTPANPPTGLCRLPAVGMDILLPRAGRIVAVPPGAICPTSLFGLLHVDETAVWRHGPLTRLPYEILLHIFSYLDLQTLCRAAHVSRLFRCLADDALAGMTSLNLQAYWPWLTDTGLLSLGKRLGRVNLTARAAAECTTGNSVIPVSLFRRREKEEEVYQRSRHRYTIHGTLAARVRSWSTSAAVNVLREVEQLSPNHTPRMSTGTSRSTNPLPLLTHDIALDSERGLTQLLSRTGNLFSPEFLETYYAAFPTCKLKRLDISWCGNYSQITPAAFGNFLGDACRQLVTLRLSSCKFLNDDCLLHIVNTCRLIQELDLSSCTGITAHGFLTLGRLIHLRWVSLYRTHINDAGLLSLAGQCQHLKHVNMGSCMDVQDMDRILNDLIRNNPGIISLNLWRCVNVSAVGIEHVIQSCPLLEELDLGWCRNIALTQEAGCIRRLVQHCPRIKKLFLTGTSLLNSEDLIFVAQCLGSNLEQLDIHGSTNVNSNAVMTLLNHCSGLRLLDISFCTEIHLYTVMHLRQLFPHCCIITSVRDMNAEVLGDPAHQLMVDALIDELDDPFARLIPHALPGGPELLALPAPNPLPAIAGPAVD
ncbi:unnamed protein product [Calicophoron daubneyi]|uniref:F-box domain-containing protein n=1 Tax=Calicophoron daubneyi TaxID=300641 RepID=A0AAV2T6U2_CALDB